jgi:hypothetical protein
MKPWIWLRAATALQAFGTFGHTMAGTPVKATRGPQEEALFSAMRTFRVTVMGSNRSHWDFYQGFGVTITVNFLVLTILLWQLSSLSRTDSKVVRPMVVTILFGHALLIVVGTIYFFIAPIVVSILTVLCLTMALVAINREAQQGQAAPRQLKAS